MKHLILMPTYDESGNIEPLIKEIFERHPQIHILVVDDNSPDGTGIIVNGLLKNYPNLFIIHRKGRSGMSSAYREGFNFFLDRDYNYLITMDADFSHHPKDLRRFLEESKRFDVIIGSRYLPGSVFRNYFKMTNIISRTGNIYARLITGLPLTDLTSGFNCYSKPAVEAISVLGTHPNMFMYLVEVKHLLFNKGFKILEIPITFLKRAYGSSKLSRRMAFETFIAVWRLRLKRY